MQNTMAVKQNTKVDEIKSQKPYFENDKISIFKEDILKITAISRLFVFSAALTGLLVFGRPVLWYFDGRKKEALSLLAHTLAIFLVITIIALFLLLLSA